HYHEAVGAGAPVDDFSFVDAVAGVGGGGQARGVAGGAIDVDGLAAGAADEVMVVVADAIFVKRGGTSGLDAADEALVGEKVEGVVDGLPGDDADFGADAFGDFVGGAVGPVRHGAKHGKTLGRDLDAVVAQEVGRVGNHGDRI